MQEVINCLKLAACIIGVVYAFKWLAAYCKHKMTATASIDVNRWISRIEQDMSCCTSFESLDRLEEKGNKVLEKAKALIPDTSPYAERLLKAYNSRHIDLTNIHCPGWPQSALRLINLR
ncbi:hypothetical protein SAMN05192529_1105 [Arachidicoccus rhizosphaerae]|uniref:Uncharacterized protein n=1 Tax=Arachidicoccus rhizosphaerae TaxID=551991 RepID=A0A1H3Z428_9BACT|nr:hypothetical protein [Arachidicoccus rhizosphaerae]SEA18426.1 hypothetical protein SAMN05192529_1105 [Arachidicoccus rhizosphaerae]